MLNNQLDILEVPVTNIDYDGLTDAVFFAIKNKEQITITGINVNSINLMTNDDKFKESLLQIILRHPDGVGLFLASKFIYGKNGFLRRITGSDFYNILRVQIIKNNWSLFFFGDEDKTLQKIPVIHPELKIKGMQNGFDYENGKLISTINRLKPDILLVGLGSPIQENWIARYKSSLNVNVIIAVGDGIKVFAGMKRRGTKFIQKIGLEWFVRLVFEPKRLWKRYLLGNPLFIFRVIKYKFSKEHF